MVDDEKAVRRLSGTVVDGEKRGRLLGFPTANLRMAAGTELPAFGVYAGRSRGHAAAVSVGIRPTFGNDLEPLVEVHLLDFDGDLYGERLEVELVEYVRPEARFESAEALCEQIARDVDATREALR